MTDNSELYYVEMEAARNMSADGYFKARQHLDSGDARKIFCAGFERAFEFMWCRATAVEEATASETKGDQSGEG